MASIRALLLRNAVLAVLIPLLALTLFLMHDQEQAGREALDRSLLVATRMASQLLDGEPPAALQDEVEKLDRALGVRLTVIRMDGTVIADTEAAPARMENHGTRPEVLQALGEGIGRAERRSETLKERMRYLAVAAGTGPERRVYRASAPLAKVEAQIRRTQLALLAGVIAVLLFSAFLSARLSQQLVTPVEALSEAAARFSAGEPNVHVIPDGPKALQRLGATFNEMTDRLNSQLRHLDQAQGYLDAVIRQMPEGLLVLDSRGAVTHANAAAEALVGLTADRILGRPILGVLLSYALDTEVSRVLAGAHAAEARTPEDRTSGERPTSSLEVRGPDGRALWVAVGPLQVAGKPAGAVLILQDVSQLRRADAMRRDFVANVSHELRTPVAAIRALVETLMLRSEKRPELLTDYGPRIVAECERIDRLVQDLLLLAQTESGHLRLQPELLDPRETAAEVIRQVEPLATASGSRLELDPFADEGVYADPFALGQCMRNLVDNAVRHAAGGSVRIGSRIEREEVVLYVADNGPGIPPEDLPRIFERFYRVDKARSRERGGSGLGLSIVRHLMEIQGGRVWVESRVGQGSTFYLAFPKGGASPPHVRTEHEQAAPPT
jgi:two-component system, OmpR family, phosphate regulon sensor histidine kinase PhoR